MSRIELHLEGEVIELNPSRTKPQGIVRIKWTALNRHGDAVHSFSAASPQLMATLTTVAVE